MFLRVTVSGFVQIREELRANGIDVYPQKEFDEDAEDRMINDKIRVSSQCMCQCVQTVHSRTYPSALRDFCMVKLKPLIWGLISSSSLILFCFHLGNLLSCHWHNNILIWHKETVKHELKTNHC